MRVDTVSVGLQFLISTNRSDQKIFRVILFVQPCSTTSKQFLEKFGLNGFAKNWDFEELSTALNYYQDLSAAWEMPVRWRGYPEISPGYGRDHVYEQRYWSRRAPGGCVQTHDGYRRRLAGAR